MTVRVRSITASIHKSDAFIFVFHLHLSSCIPQGSGCTINHSTRERQNSCTPSVPDKEGRQTTTLLRSVQVIVADQQRQKNQYFFASGVVGCNTECSRFSVQVIN